MISGGTAFHEGDSGRHRTEQVRSFRPAWFSYVIFGASMAVVLLPALVRGLGNGAADRADWSAIEFLAVAVVLGLLSRSRVRVVFGPDHVSYFIISWFFSRPKSLRYSDIERDEVTALHRGTPSRLSLIPRPESGRRRIVINLKPLGTRQISEMLALLYAGLPHPPAAPRPDMAPGSPVTGGGAGAGRWPASGMGQHWRVRLRLGRRALTSVRLLLVGVCVFADLAFRTPLVPAVFLVASILGALLYELRPIPQCDFMMVSDREVRSRLGFSVRLNPPLLKYIEGNLILTLSAQQPPGGTFQLQVSNSSMWAWDPPFQGEQLARKKAARIRKSLIAALALMHAHRPGQSAPQR